VREEGTFDKEKRDKKRKRREIRREGGGMRQ
jgi:hypothetical protein